jgi:putative Ca2+/H+ antiporter (TMEM165/GDT1 family)
MSALPRKQIVIADARFIGRAPFNPHNQTILLAMAEIGDRKRLSTLAPTLV